MARVRFDDGTVITFDGIPTPQDIEDAYTRVKGATPIAQSPLQRTEQTIANRRSAVRSFIDETVRQGQVDFGTLLGVAALGAAAESVPANFILAAEKGQLPQWLAPMVPRLQQSGTNFPQVGRDVLAGITGERPTEMGDVYTAGGIPRPIASILGLASIPGGAQGMAEGAKLGLGMARGGLRGLTTAAQVTGEFLQGNPQRIEKAADAVVSSFRRGGALHQKVRDLLHLEGEKAWAPMTQVVDAIPEPIQLQELQEVATKQFGADPDRLKVIQQTLESFRDRFTRSQDMLTMTTPPQGISAQQLVQLSSDLGSQMNTSAKVGKTIRPLADQVLADLRSVIADTLELKAPPELQGSVQAAKMAWADYATTRRLLFNKFGPFQSPDASTNAGVSLLRRVAMGKAHPSEARFVEGLGEKLGTDLTKTVRRQVGVGRAGTTTKYAGMAAPPLYGLLRILGRRE